MRVVKGLARPADAYQFLKETEDQLVGLVLQTGPVTVQKEDELNRIPGRCYVPTIWGAAVLEYGDWFVVYDVGIVSVHTDAQFRLLFEFDDSATLFEVSEEPELEAEQVAEARRGTYSAMMSKRSASKVSTGISTRSWPRRSRLRCRCLRWRRRCGSGR